MSLNSKVCKNDALMVNIDLKIDHLGVLITRLETFS